MPELPEVETVRLGLQRLLPGRVIAHVESDWPKSFPNSEEDVKAFLLGAEILQVRRRAKVLLIDLTSEYTLVIHLKMTGQLVFVQKTSGSKVEGKKLKVSEAELRFGAGHPNDSLIGELPDKSTRVTFTFLDGSKLFFNDQRKFGWIRLLPTKLIDAALTGSALEANARKRGSAQRAVQVVRGVSTGVADAAVVQELSQPAELGLARGESGADAVIDFMQKVGPEPLEADFTPDILFNRIQRRKNSNIKAVLLDQTVLAGVGNIYADEALWAAKIHPETLVKDLSKQQVALLHEVLVAVLRLSIEKGGSSNHTYVNAEGKKGSYMNFANVFRRDGEACPRCGTTIIKLKVAGRGTHICPVCQKVDQKLS